MAIDIKKIADYAQLVGSKLLSFDATQVGCVKLAIEDPHGQRYRSPFGIRWTPRWGAAHSR